MSSVASTKNRSFWTCRTPKVSFLAKNVWWTMLWNFWIWDKYFTLHIPCVDVFSSTPQYSIVLLVLDTSCLLFHIIIPAVYVSVGNRLPLARCEGHCSSTRVGAADSLISTPWPLLESPQTQILQGKCFAWLRFCWNYRMTFKCTHHEANTKANTQPIAAKILLFSRWYGYQQGVPFSDRITGFRASFIS